MNIGTKFIIVISLLFSTCISSAYADGPVYSIKISKNLFYPDIITVTAGTRFKLVIENQDSSPEEFDSFELNREKVIMGNAAATLYIGPLQIGSYPFFGEFNPETAQGKIIVIPANNAK